MSAKYMPWSVWGFNTLGIVSLYIMLYIAGRRGGQGGCVCVAQSVGSFRAPPPSLDKRESGAHPGRLAFVLGFCTTVSPLRHLVVRGLAQLRNDAILVSSRSLSDCYFISRAARKSVKISFPRLLIFACVAMSAAAVAAKRKSW